jgi:excinuclease ABC subunit B
MPEVSLVAIFDADKEGFLRSEKALIQTIGRAARHLHGKAILYGNRVTNSMQLAIDETIRRREIQEQHNQKNNVTPLSIKKSVLDIMEGARLVKNKKPGDKKVAQNRAEYLVDVSGMNAKELIKQIKVLEEKMISYSKNLEFEEAAAIRDEVARLRLLSIQL